jgi:hypothetical protein
MHGWQVRLRDFCTCSVIERMWLFVSEEFHLDSCFPKQNHTYD